MSRCLGFRPLALLRHLWIKHVRICLLGGLILSFGLRVVVSGAGVVVVSQLVPNLNCRLENLTLRFRRCDIWRLYSFVLRQREVRRVSVWSDWICTVASVGIGRPIEFRHGRYRWDWLDDEASVLFFQILLLGFLLIDYFTADCFFRCRVVSSWPRNFHL